jgi:hypothetical protein
MINVSETTLKCPLVSVSVIIKKQECVEEQRGTCNNVPMDFDAQKERMSHARKHSCFWGEKEKRNDM